MKTTHDYKEKYEEEFKKHGFKLDTGLGHMVLTNIDGDCANLVIVSAYELEMILKVLDLKKQQ